jgi:hypothetical protein
MGPRPSRSAIRGCANRRRRYDDLNKSGRDVIDESGYKPLARQRGNGPERSNVDRKRRPRIGDRFCLEFPLLYLKIVGQQGGVASKASDAAIGVVKYDDVKLATTSGNFSGNLTDSTE